MMIMIEKWMKLDGFSGYFKLDCFCEIFMYYFMDVGEGFSIRVIVFSEYWDSVEEIV